jgi:hypothetical protein
MNTILTLIKCFTCEKIKQNLMLIKQNINNTTYFVITQYVIHNYKIV